VAWNFWQANCGDDKERRKVERGMYEPLAPLPFAPDRRAASYDGWTLTAWKPGQRGVVNRG
jgi:hypothetical protein